ncbi:hypothetical protein EWM64_g5698 [Hericium alpestre]|uniref:GmrSD restriction endonucleases N-terminal domain-containing protein n=1 Tax=Hericium alpestre TaxID=135208 RepID=A0A4Y9ZUP5_9AGAM|nr:hypothetical protein EWM64_g5698 [Hericium alpestre]
MSESESWDEEEEVPVTQNRKRNSGKSYTVKHKLKPPRTTTYSTQSLYDEIYEDNINLAPEYQRDVVWPQTKQMALIDSIYRNFYIPPIIFAVTTSDDGTEKKTCIDGKQRLSSIQRFMDGLIPVKEQDTERKFWYKGRNPFVGDSWRKTFAHRQIVCVEYVELSDADEREIFRRVQLGVALTPAEVMRAETHSPRVKLVQSIVDNQMLYLEKVFNMKRGAPFRWVTQSILTISTWSSGRHPATTADTLKKWIKEPDEPNSAMAQKIQDSYTILKNFILDDKTFLNVTRGPKKIAPIDLPFMITFIYLFKDRFAKEQLSSGIKLMREIVRQEHTDILWNAKVLGTYVYFIDDFQIKGLDALENPLPPRTQHPQGIVANAFMQIDGPSLPTPAPSQASMSVLSASIQHVQQPSQQSSQQHSQQQSSQQSSQQQQSKKPDFTNSRVSHRAQLNLMLAPHLLTLPLPPIFHPFQSRQQIRQLDLDLLSHGFSHM